MPVTTLTANAQGADKLSEQDYREIYLELSAGHTTRQIEAMLGAYSNAWWSEFGKGRKPCTREARQALRKAVGLAPLPATVAEAIAGVNPDAEVLRITAADGPTEDLPAPDRVILANASERLFLTLADGQVAITQDAAPAPAVTPVTAPDIERRRPAKPRVGRTPTRATEDQERRRSALAVPWRDVYEAGLSALERAQKGEA